MAQAPLPVSVLHKRQREIDQIKSRRTKNARANGARRKAVLGAFMVVLDRRAGVPAIETLLRTELANFLRRDRTPARNIALLQEVLGPF